MIFKNRLFQDPTMLQYAVGFMTVLTAASVCHSRWGNRVAQAPVVRASGATNPPLEVAMFLESWLIGASSGQEAGSSGSTPNSHGGAHAEGHSLPVRTEENTDVFGRLLVQARDRDAHPDGGERLLAYIRDSQSSSSLIAARVRMIDVPVANLQGAQEEQEFTSCVVTAHSDERLSDKVRRYEEHANRYPKSLTGLAATNRKARLLHESGQVYEAYDAFAPAAPLADALGLKDLYNLNLAMLLIEMNQCTQAEELLQGMGPRLASSANPFERGLYQSSMLLLSILYDLDRREAEGRVTCENALTAALSDVEKFKTEQWPALYAAAAYARLMTWYDLHGWENAAQLPQNQMAFRKAVPLNRWTWRYHNYVQHL